MRKLLDRRGILGGIPRNRTGGSAGLDFPKTAHGRHSQSHDWECHEWGMVWAQSALGGVVSLVRAFECVALVSIIKKNGVLFASQTRCQRMVILGRCRPTRTARKSLTLLIVGSIWQAAQNALKIRVSTVQFRPPAPPSNLRPSRTCGHSATTSTNPKYPQNTPVVTQAVPARIQV